jgi:hypothetical protein
VIPDDSDEDLEKQLKLKEELLRKLNELDETLFSQSGPGKSVKTENEENEPGEVSSDSETGQTVIEKSGKDGIFSGDPKKCKEVLNIVQESTEKQETTEKSCQPTNFSPRRSISRRWISKF